MLQLLLQLPNALGFTAMILTGRLYRWGWLVAAASEIAWFVWGYLSANPGIYPWCAAWFIVFIYNYFLWKRKDTNAKQSDREVDGVFLYDQDAPVSNADEGDVREPLPPIRS